MDVDTHLVFDLLLAVGQLDVCNPLAILFVQWL